MTNDKIIRGLMAEGNVNFIAISGREMVKEAQRVHGLSRVCTAALGRTLMMTAMMSVQLKGKNDRVTCIIKGGGPAGNIVCTGRQELVKGYIENPGLELPPAPNGKLDVSMAVGWFGEMVIIKDLGLKEPYVGRCEMISGEIAEDFANYYVTSEQQPSIVYLGVRMNAQSKEVLSAGGLLIQPMPECPGSVIDLLQKKASRIGMLSEWLEKGKGLEDTLLELLPDLDIRVTDSLSTIFSCDCSRERIERVLISMGEEELKDMMAKEHGAELKCDFCNSVYNFKEEELGNLLKNSLSREDG
jgi:molecular chaperone Hsp33